MKNAIIIGIMSATILMVGCSKEPSSSSTTVPLGSKPVVVTDGSNTWFLGATTTNGSNVSVAKITGVRRSKAAYKVGDQMEGTITRNGTNIPATATITKIIPTTNTMSK